jgi:hypothetical protein
MEGYDNVVSLEYRVDKAFEGRYFMGHTPTLVLPACGNVWAALYNPPGSGVNVYINTFTVSNFSALPFRIQLWLNALAVGGLLSPYVCPTNAAYVPSVWPKAVVDYGQGVLQGGCSLFTRVAGAQSTEVGNYYGKIVVPPGGTLLALLQSTSVANIQTEVAFGWWEDPVQQGYIEAASKEGK